MKSSEAVFTKKNPFPPEPRRTKSHYSPTRAKKIPKQQKKLVLSPVRFTQSASPPESPPLSPEDQRFLEGSHNVLLCPPPSVKELQNFSESWPSTDQSSSPASTDVQHPQHTVTSRMQEPSVLGKYIERFRYGRPQSRGERQKLTADGADDQPFWWMSSNPSQPSSSTPTRTSKEHSGGMLQLLANTNFIVVLAVFQALSDSPHCEQLEPGIFQLQERARKLLQRSEHTLSSGSSGVPISSEGLGCSDFSDPVSVDEPIRKPTVPSLIDTASFITPRGPFHVATAPGPVGSRPRPEDDILFQWRLRRKMEQARQWSHTSSHSSALYQPLLSRLTLQPGLSFTGGVSIPASCPVPEPVPSSSSQVHPASCINTKAESISQSQTVSVPPYDREMGPKQTAHYIPQPCLRGQVWSSESSGELCTKPQYSSSPSPSPQHAESSGCQGRTGMQSSSRVEGGRGKKKSVMCPQKKKSDRYVGDRDMVEKNQQNVKGKDRHARGQEKVRSKNKENAGHRESQSSTRGVRPRDSPSPVHNTLGQVVSEVLFPSADAPVQPRTSRSSTTPAPPHSPAPPPQRSSHPSEVIGQLMQEAEDSDGMEFEDDPLLLVLRQQRKWVKEQLCEVDRMLDKFHKD
ncbi:hypothetical protein QTP70_015234 [Hemibagrus guttatus]|uniref:Proline and serine rich 3 n=1 Tax=Hemibagrus guttatus TaxID=175788 RepID=A0AAE0QRY4_9TELE|nr:hypothetical protein QTP70_015234 [Hemibagrus guttatus]